jgi:hypothetical protein
MEAYQWIQGSAVFQTKMAGAPEKIMKSLVDEELELNWPVYIFMMQLDGTVKWWQFFNTNWRNNNLLFDFQY